MAEAQEKKADKGGKKRVRTPQATEIKRVQDNASAVVRRREKKEEADAGRTRNAELEAKVAALDEQLAALAIGPVPSGPREPPVDVRRGFLSPDDLKQGGCTDHPSFVAGLHEFVERIRRTPANEATGLFDIAGGRKEIQLGQPHGWLQPLSRPTVNKELTTEAQRLSQRSCYYASSILRPSDKRIIDQLLKGVDVATRRYLKEQHGHDCFFIHTVGMIFGGKQLAQLPHIDLMKGEYQFAITLTRGEATRIYQGKEEISLEYLAEVSGYSVPELLADERFSQRGFPVHARELMLSRAEIESNMGAPAEMESTTFGDALVLAGGKVHGGPESAFEDRAILFFVVSPLFHTAPYVTDQFWPADIEVALSLTAKTEHRRQCLDRAVLKVVEWRDVFNEGLDVNLPHNRATAPFKQHAKTKEDKNWFNKVIGELKAALIK